MKVSLTHKMKCCPEQYYCHSIIKYLFDEVYTLVFQSMNKICLKKITCNSYETHESLVYIILI